MLQHDILTKEEEFGLGNEIIHAKQLRDQMADIIETMRMEEDENNLEELLWGNGNGGVDAVWPSIHLEGMEAMSTYDIPSAEQKMDDPFDSSWGQSLENRNYEGDSRISSTLVQDGSKLNRQAVEADLRLLTDEDVRTKMNLKGGKEELREILALGSEARTTLMKSNIRLVVSIGKKWMGSSFAAGNSNGASTINLNNGGWDRPSLDEVIQEGILGLTRAVDKFDPSRGLRFSTYSTHWITSYVRQCFQTASTGCLQVPSQLHEIKVSQSILSVWSLILYEDIFENILTNLDL
jgi:RNA polymerase sigma factor (sigma-70 family)